MILLICRIFKNGTNELIYKAEIATDVEHRLMVSTGEMTRVRA